MFRAQYGKWGWFANHQCLSFIFPNFTRYLEPSVMETGCSRAGLVGSSVACGKRAGNAMVAKNGVLNSLIVLSPIAGQSRGLSPLNELQCLLFPREQEMVRRSDCDFHVWNHLSCLHSAQECCHLPGLFLLPQ